jgi:hypothetical protein
MSGRVQRATAPLISMEEASQRFDQLVYDGVYELLDLHGLLELEQGLWQALFDCGVPRAEAPRFSAQLIARALTRIGEAHIKLAAPGKKEQRLPPRPVRRTNA